MQQKERNDNITMGDEDVEGALKIFREPNRGSEKVVGPGGGGLRKSVYFKTNRRGRGTPKNLNR